MLLLALLFLLGVSIGALGMYFWGGRLVAHDRWPYSHNEFIAKLSHDVRLNSAQQAQLRVILDDAGGRFRAIDEQMRPARDAVRKDARAKIRAILAPDQQARLDEFFQEIDKERRQAEAGH